MIELASENFSINSYLFNMTRNKLFDLCDKEYKINTEEVMQVYFSGLA